MSGLLGKLSGIPERYLTHRRKGGSLQSGLCRTERVG